MKKIYFNVIGKRNLWFFISFFVFFIAFIIGMKLFFYTQPVFNYGIDFKGGNTYLLRLPLVQDKLLQEKVNKNNVIIDYIEQFRSILSDFSLNKSSIQFVDDGDVLIKTLAMDQDLSSRLLKKFREKFGEVEILEIDYIGPSIGEELKKKSIWIVLLISLVLLVYVTFRFEFFYGIAALFALFHDALMVLSFAVIFQFEINLAFVAALLTILGYSINDTIVIFDRVRENESELDGVSPLDYIINFSLNQTFKRTINTSLTTLIVVGSMVVFGGITIQSFCLLLFIGVIIGTYSSIFIASPFLYFLFLKKNS